MAKLKAPVSVETTFGTYILEEQIGEGGSGRVYGGTGPDNNAVAVKVLSADRATSDKRRRFKNEIAFLLRNKHSNIVSVIDHGIATHKTIAGPFYVMRRYETNLRNLIKAGIRPEAVLALYGKILDGVEGAHLLGAIHRDLKPENVLADRTSVLAVADFGVASFTDDIIATRVETGPTQRLANFMYAAPEQRSPGKQVDARADIYALGLILNEMFTGDVPHGSDYRTVKDIDKNFAFFDLIIVKMIKQNPTERLASIAEVKQQIQLHHAEFASLQKLSSINDTVIPEGEIDDPLAFNPVKITNVDWANGTLTLTLDRPVTPAWIHALRNMGGHSAVMGKGPEVFQFSGNMARVSSAPNDVQRIIDHFKGWMPQTTATLERDLRLELDRKKYEREQSSRLSGSTKKLD